MRQTAGASPLFGARVSTWGAHRQAFGQDHAGQQNLRWHEERYLDLRAGSVRPKVPAPLMIYQDGSGYGRPMETMVCSMRSTA